MLDFKKTRIIVLLIAVLLGHALSQAAPTNFEQAKEDAKAHVYFDRTDDGDFYCGCDWKWVGRSGGRTELSSCGYVPRAQAERAARTEWEHVVPAYDFGHQRQCWQQGGRSNCKANDPVFSVMESDMHNLVVAVGEVNGDRSNYRFSDIPGEASQYGACDAETDFKARKFEPRPEVRGMVARISFYMADRYNLRLSRQQEQLFMAWHKMHPVSEWERERDRRIASQMGHSNPFVTGHAQWQRGHKNSSSGLVQPIQRKSSTVESKPTDQGGIRGNKNSRVYHLSVGCPSFDRVAVHNRIEFSSEQAAAKAGYRKAGNCK